MPTREDKKPPVMSGAEETLPAGSTAEVELDATAAAGPPAAPVSGPEVGDAGRLVKGDSLGRYLIIEALGAGGMGVVYKGYDPELERQVALKLLSPRVRAGSGGDARARLQREAQAMARLAHPHIVTVYDVGTWQGQVYVAMELVDGPTLDDWLAREKPPLADLIDRFLQAAEGLAAAHAADLVHRDFKPQNVLVGGDGRVRVMDFGLARHASDMRPDVAPDAAPDAAPEAGIEDSPTALGTPLTRAGTLMGTPAYMSPEQFRGEAVDARSDQFSFAVALHEAVFGVRPFAGDTFDALQGAVCAGTRVAVEPHRAPAWLVGLLDRALAVDPADRFGSMGALIAALRRGRHRRRRLTLAALVVGALGLIIGGGIYLQQRAAGKDRQRRRVQRRLAAEKARRERLDAHLALLRRRRIQLLEALARADQQQQRDELLCQIGGLEHVIRKRGTNMLREAIRAVFRRCAPVLRRCYEQTLEGHPKAAGTIAAFLRTDREGRVVEVTFRRDTVGVASLRECLRRQFQVWRLPNGGEKPIEITYPMHFRPKG